MKTKSMIVGIGSLVLATFAVLLGRSAAAQTDKPERIIVTTCDLSRPYDVIEAVASYQEFKAFSFKGDPLVHALKAANAQLEAAARTAGANAVIGLRIDFENRTEKDEGRLLAYGTIVRFK